MCLVEVFRGMETLVSQLYLFGRGIQSARGWRGLDNLARRGSAIFFYNTYRLVSTHSEFILSLHFGLNISPATNALRKMKANATFTASPLDVAVAFVCFL